ncbi:unnamed protein product [Diabrotica balteata]|uniref:LysM domain-containing protein n=1 Tax=Diabrotica balteata TaxID=107213 RepID=A0A9N9XD82_DIABA|nr:unnamed protein product [Diabrotica balteata]
MDRWDRGSYERLSIRESAQCLKKYGSTNKRVTKNESYIKHYVTNTDTLQGIALKYNVTIEQIRRANKLWTSDSLFLREFLLIPSEESSSSNISQEQPQALSQSTVTSPCSSSFDEEDIDGFLNKIDAAIASNKQGVEKTTRNSEFASSVEQADRRQPAVSRMKQLVNNNTNPLGSEQNNPSHPNAVVIQQGNKVRTSLRQHERQQDELFQL